MKGAIGGAVALLVVYLGTLAPDVTFWDAGEFIASAHSLGIPHPPGTPLFVLLINVWAKLLFFLPYAVATNLFSAVATAAAGGITASLVHRGTGSRAMAFSAAIAAGSMSSVWLNATETEVYAASLALGVLTIWCAERAGRDERERWTCLTAYLIALSVPLHLSALVAAPVAIVLATYTAGGIRWRRGAVLGGTMVFALGLGRMTWWICAAGAFIMMAAALRPRGATRLEFKMPGASLLLAALAGSVILMLYVRAPFDPAINQGDPGTWASLAEMVARRQYDVAPMWPRSAPVWIQLANFGQYADWQAALSFGPTVMPSPFRTLFTVVFAALGYAGALAHWRADRRSWLGVLVLFLGGSLGVIAYLNLHAGPSIGYGMLPENVVREARERDYFFVFAFWAWGIWAGIGAVSFAKRLSRPAWAGASIACLPIVLNWRAVTRREEPERTLPRAFAEAMLLATPSHGVLFVVGDNDSYPLWYAQEVTRTRPDVAVVTIPLLPTHWYRRQIATRFGLLSAADAERFDGRMETAARIARGARAVHRPVAAAMTLTAGERARIGDHWSAAGLVYVEGSTPTDTAANRRWASWVERRLGARQPREAIDPVAMYYRRMLDCPRALANAPAPADSGLLDSVCNYK